MSLGYAEKLSYKEDVGSVGMSEIFDSPTILQHKIEELALLIQQSKHLVAFTGAGISTSCGIPDFRGPKGVWTLQREGKGVPQASLPFHRAMPSFTHMALVELEKAGILKFVISQNVDSLHLRSGIPREKLSELHGNSFRELCPSCGVEYVRDFEVETIGLKETSRRCSNEKCGAKLKDTDALPPKEMNQAEKHCRMADVVLCLGTSLQITPACNLPLKCIRGGGKIVIVNLQHTPKDKKANLVIHGRVDKVIAGAIKFLNLRISPYVRIDLVNVVLKYSARKSETKVDRIFKAPGSRLSHGPSFCTADKRYVTWNLRIASVHGQRAPLPFLRSVEVFFPERPELKTAHLCKQPFKLRREMLEGPFKLLVKLNFGDGCGCPCASIEFPVNFEVLTNSFKTDKGAVLQNLRDTAIQDLCCGQHAVVERKTILAPRSDVAVCAIVTNIIEYDSIVLNSEGDEGFPKSNGSIVKRLDLGSRLLRLCPNHLFILQQERLSKWLETVTMPMAIDELLKAALE
ncbi:hypothetical protein IFM89_022357 [Coptis chinensis]|uniref:NAD-dependent protein deacetylase SRT1 n=1 Tax=Coptis chinensis TaxID=261450 RepID=A0A835H0F3_9MAGN|nr:hypothetical protein IFM89_022357 [Coptis chinensis]